MLMLVTTKLTEYTDVPFGRLGAATVCDIFCNFSRSTVADPPVTGRVIVSVVTSLAVELVLLEVEEDVLAEVVVLLEVVGTGSATNSVIAE